MGRQENAADGHAIGRPAARPGAVGRHIPRRLVVPVATVVVVAALLAATLVFTRQAPSTAEASCAAKGAESGLAVGQCAPDFTLAQPDGQRLSLTAFRGHPVLLHFWAVGCTTCAGEYPDFLRAVAAYQPKGLRVLAVDAWGEPSALVQLWRQSHHLAATYLIDEPQAVVRQYGVQGTPTTFFLDRTGRITATNSGPLSYAAFQHAIDKII